MDKIYELDQLFVQRNSKLTEFGRTRVQHKIEKIIRELSNEELMQVCGL